MVVVVLLLLLLLEAPRRRGSRLMLCWCDDVVAIMMPDSPCTCPSPPPRGLPFLHQTYNKQQQQQEQREARPSTHRSVGIGPPPRTKVEPLSLETYRTTTINHVQHQQPAFVNRIVIIIITIIIIINIQHCKHTQKKNDMEDATARPTVHSAFTTPPPPDGLRGGS
jgi:hypothetical protein